MTYKTATNSQRIPLKDITLMIKRGITPKYTDVKGIEVINQRCIRDSRINLELVRLNDTDKRKISEEKYLQKYDVLVNSTGVGTLGRVAQYLISEKTKRTVDSHVTIVRPIKNIDPIYFGYAIRNEEILIESLGEGSTGQTELSRHRLGEEIRINVPSSEEQKAIANILSSLDDKIEINNSIIANLEEQSQAIFKSWFMDSALFQDEEFETKKLGELFEFIKGKKPKTISEVKKEGFVPYLVKKYIDGDEATFTSSDDGILIDDLDIFMLMDGANSGNIYYGYHGILGSTFSFLKNVNEMVNEYIYWYLLINQESVKNQNTGSAIPHANKDYINNLEVAVPIDIETNKVLKRLKDIRLYTINIRRENNKLSETRDTLLPKLMSGEIRVEDTIEVKEM